MKSVEHLWAEFSADVIAKNATCEQIKTQKYIFYATVHKTIFQIKHEAHTNQSLTAIMNECKSFMCLSLKDEAKLTKGE